MEILFKSSTICKINVNEKLLDLQDNILAY